MLVIGATGILRPVVSMLLERGHSVLAVARTADTLAALASTAGARVRVRAVDALDASALAHALADLRELPAAGAIVYGPTVTADGWTLLARLVDGPVVRVLTSGAADPDRGEAISGGPPFATLVLGWTPDRRWHTPVEVSRAAMSVWDRANSDRANADRADADADRANADQADADGAIVDRANADQTAPHPDRFTPDVAVLGRVRPWRDRPR